MLAAKAAVVLLVVLGGAVEPVAGLTSVDESSASPVAFVEFVANVGLGQFLVGSGGYALATQTGKAFLMGGVLPVTGVVISLARDANEGRSVRVRLLTDPGTTRLNRVVAVEAVAMGATALALRTTLGG